MCQYTSDLDIPNNPFRSINTNHQFRVPFRPTPIAGLAYGSNNFGDFKGVGHFEANF